MSGRAEAARSKSMSVSAHLLRSVVQAFQKNVSPCREVARHVCLIYVIRILGFASQRTTYLFSNSRHAEIFKGGSMKYRSVIHNTTWYSSCTAEAIQLKVKIWPWLPDGSERRKVLRMYKANTVLEIISNSDMTDPIKSLALTPPILQSWFSDPCEQFLHPTLLYFLTFLNIYARHPLSCGHCCPLHNCCSRVACTRV